MLHVSTCMFSNYLAHNTMLSKRTCVITSNTAEHYVMNAYV